MSNPPPVIKKAANIGLLGGSFNPPHQGHREISLAALEAMDLDQVWWLVSPGNPQKDPKTYADESTRLKASVAMANHPRIHVSDFEFQSGTRYSLDTIKALKSAFPEINFVWLIGADNLASFHSWKNWQEIMAALPLAVFNRPGFRQRALSSPAARFFARERVPTREIRRLGHRSPPAWAYIGKTANQQSATQLRQTNPEWPKKFL
jgi:nicotinate-nucleotide adenylyltransferase